MTWAVERVVGPAANLHAKEPPAPVGRAVWVLEPTGPAVVLGSAQPDTVVDGARAAAAGVAVVRRRSGGGAVWVEPGECLWVDVLVPRGDPHWDDDVGRAAHWVGEAWAAALADEGVTAGVHRAGLVRARWSDLVCFAGTGPGEVLVGGRKLVGLSQRRTRGGARFQCVVHRRWDVGPLLDLLVLGEGERRAAGADLAGAAIGADDLGVALDGLARGLIAHLPAPMC